MEKVYKCQTCGVVTSARQQVCAPQPVDSKRDYCGSGIDRERLCQDMRLHVSYVCSKCGRAAEQEGLLCDPLAIG